MSIPGPVTQDTPSRPSVMEFSRRWVTWGLWFLVVLGTVYLALHRIHVSLVGVPTSADGYGGDFWGYLEAGKKIAAGRNPYDPAQLAQGYGYVYTPWIALLLASFAHVRTLDMWRAWTTLSVGSLVGAAAVVASTQIRPLNSWRRPVLFGFCGLTAVEFSETKFELYNGNVDMFVILLFALGALALVGRRSPTTGVLIGLAGLVKTWPAVALLLFAGKRDRFESAHLEAAEPESEDSSAVADPTAGEAAEHRSRRGWYCDVRIRAVGVAVAVLFAGPVLAAVLGGWTELKGFFESTFDARSQNLISFSVEGIPRVLFSKTGLTQPLLTSAPLRMVATAILIVWVVVLLVAAVRFSRDKVLAFWHVVACIILLLPVSHKEYSLFFLPLMWTWASRALATWRVRSVEAVQCLALVIWWLAVDLTATMTTSPVTALGWSVVFFANLFALTTSMVSEHLASTQRLAVGVGVVLSS